MPEVAVVVPVFNNLATLPTLAKELTAALDQMGCDWEVIWVDDASSDGSWAWIQDQCERSTRHRGVRLGRNRGQSLAVCVGVAHAPAGAVVVTIDADLEYSPADIGPMVAAVEDPRCFVAGIRPTTNPRGWSSTMFNAAVRSLTGYREGDVGCGFLAMGSELAAAAARAGVRGLALRPYLAGNASTTVRRAVRYEPAGSSSTGLRPRVRIAVDFLAADPRPARRLGLVGLVALALGTRHGHRCTTGTIGLLGVVAGLVLVIRGARLRHRLDVDPPSASDVAGRSPDGRCDASRSMRH